jgi:hypothetical protein
LGIAAIRGRPGGPPPAAPPGVGESPSPDGPALGEALVAEDAFGDEAIGANATGDHRAIEQEPAGLSVDAADLELALRYVPDYRVLVLADPPDDLDGRALPGGGNGDGRAEAPSPDPVGGRCSDRAADDHDHGLSVSALRQVTETRP